MKKLICAATLLSGSILAAHAQIAPGTLLVGGSLGYSKNVQKGTLPYTDTEVKQAQRIDFNVSPVAAYFLAENLAVGLSLNYSTMQATQYQYITVIPVSGIPTGSAVKSGENESTDRTFSLGPVARYYVFVGEKAAFFGQFGASYQSLRSEATSSFTTPVTGTSSYLTTGSGYGAQLAPGFAFFPTAKFGLEITLQGLNYQHLKNETSSRSDNSGGPSYPGISTSSRFDASFGLSNLQLGAAFYPGR